MIDLDALDATIASFQRVFSTPTFEISYAAKALALVPLFRKIAGSGIGVDVCSLGELLTAEAAGFAPSRITMHGCAKTDEELAAVRAGRAGRIVVDNLDELARLAADPNPFPSGIVLRINAAIEAHTHEFVHTSGRESKFGLDPQALDSAIDILARARHLRFLGLHSHIGSQIYRSDAFGENAAATFAQAARLHAAGFSSTTVVLGGGFGVTMSDDPSEALDIAAAAEAMRRYGQAYERETGTRVTIGIEPGRALIANAGTTFYRVMAVKSQFGRRYAIVDGGLYENPRPALYDAVHRMECVRPSHGASDEFVVCGRSCENDRLGVAVLPADISAGDVIAMYDTGAYTYAMASNYNRFERPAVVGVSGDDSAILARRETTAELLRLDAGPPIA